MTKKDYLINKETARKIILDRIDHLNSLYQVDVKRIAIRNQKTRWGSCSRKGNLNFNYRLMYLSPKLLDYVIVHELCHLKEFNHSPQFWELVKTTIPDYKLVRKELRKLRLV